MRVPQEGNFHESTAFSMETSDVTKGMHLVQSHRPAEKITHLKGI